MGEKSCRVQKGRQAISKQEDCGYIGVAQCAGGSVTSVTLGEGKATYQARVTRRETPVV